MDIDAMSERQRQALLKAAVGALREIRESGTDTEEQIHFNIQQFLDNQFLGSVASCHGNIRLEEIIFDASAKTVEQANLDLDMHLRHPMHSLVSRGAQACPERRVGSP